MMWKQLVAVGALAVCSSAATARALMIDGCPDGTYPVSVLDDPEVHCLSGRPCSGSYSASGIPQGVGACPAKTGCALLPHNEVIMGCVPAGRGDVTYVNADGSLMRGGKVISLQEAIGSTNSATTSAKDTNVNNNNNNNANSATTNGASTTAGTLSPAAAATATVAPSNLGGSNPSKTDSSPALAIGSQDAGATVSKNGETAGTSAGLRGSKASSGSSDSVPSPSPTTTPTPTPTTTPTPTPEQSVEHVTAQQTLNDIDGDLKANKGTAGGAGVSIASVIGIVVGCLAVIAVVAGVRLLKKDKEAVVETPEGGLDDYGGGITPKENVVLL